MRDLELIIVEDDPISQSVYLDALVGTGCHTAFCGSVASAVSLSSMIFPDVVIMDLGLPDGSGVEAIANIRGTCKTPAPYILVVTASTNSAQHQAALEAGAKSIMVKPIVEGEIRRILAQLSDS